MLYQFIYLFVQQISTKHLLCCYRPGDIEVKKAASFSLGNLDLSEKENKGNSSMH